MMVYAVAIIMVFASLEAMYVSSIITMDTKQKLEEQADAHEKSMALRDSIARLNEEETE